MAKAGTPLEGLDLAEQHLVDCGYNPSQGMNGCDGAGVGSYQKWFAESHKDKDMSHEAQYPYLDRDPNLKCMSKATWNTGAKVTKALTDYSCNEDKLKKLGKYLLFFQDRKSQITKEKLVIKNIAKVYGILNSSM